MSERSLMIAMVALGIDLTADAPGGLSPGATHAGRVSPTGVRTETRAARAPIGAGRTP